MVQKRNFGMNNGTGAVIYVRVSTDEQADGPLNLSNQEQKCRYYCGQKGFPVVRVFIDPGESARTADRPEFQQMLAYCKTHRREVGYVVSPQIKVKSLNTLNLVYSM
jgi:site-specific DNA recombinase